MDKQAMKAAFAAAELPQVPYVCVQAADLDAETDRNALVNRIEGELGYPCFVKPANLGSSVGISKVRTPVELLDGLRQAAALDPRLVVEQGVQARELEVQCSARRDCVHPWSVKSVLMPTGTTTTRSTQQVAAQP